MKWMIIVLIMMSLIGSMMWVMPTPRQKYQAKLRLKAKTKGFIVQLERITAPRAKGEMDPQERDMTAYRVLRHDKDETLTPWKIFKVESIADTGLPPGWSWAEGERTLSAEQLERVAALIADLPEGVFSIQSSPVHFSVYWDEEGGEEVMDAMYERVMQVVGEKI